MPEKKNEPDGGLKEQLSRGFTDDLLSRGISDLVAEANKKAFRKAIGIWSIVVAAVIGIVGFLGYNQWSRISDDLRGFVAQEKQALRQDADELRLRRTEVIEDFRKEAESERELVLKDAKEQIGSITAVLDNDLKTVRSDFEKLRSDFEGEIRNKMKEQSVEVGTLLEEIEKNLKVKKEQLSQLEKDVESLKQTLARENMLLAEIKNRRDYGLPKEYTLFLDERMKIFGGKLWLKCTDIWGTIVCAQIIDLSDQRVLPQGGYAVNQSSLLKIGETESFVYENRSFRLTVKIINVDVGRKQATFEISEIRE